MATGMVMKPPRLVTRPPVLEMTDALDSWLDDLSEAARGIGAVNTVIHRGGRLLGENTDAPGLLAALHDADLQDVLDQPGDGGVVRGRVVRLVKGAARGGDVVLLPAQDVEDAHPQIPSS